MNVGMHVPFQTQICKCFCVFGYIYSGIELLGHMIVLYHINNLKYADDITLMAESKQELKSLYVRVKEESEKADLELNIKKKKKQLRSWHLVPSFHGK